MMIGERIDVLDYGFVRLVEHMGGDASIVQAARVSYAQGTKGEERDRKLIRYLLQHDHGTPFEMVVFKFHVKCPIFVARQWMRHRMASYNEVSARYTEVPNDFYVPGRPRIQSPSNRQSSEPAGDQLQSAAALIDSACHAAHVAYQELLSAGVAREQARMVLPLATYTEFYTSLNARSLMNLIRLRIDSHAQWEFQQYASALLKYFRHVVPWTAEAFEAGIGT